MLPHFVSDTERRDENARCLQSSNEKSTSPAAELLYLPLSAARLESSGVVSEVVLLLLLCLYYDAVARRRGGD